MECMEIWGGNRAIDNAVSMPGLDAWIHSRPYRPESQGGESGGGDIHYLSSCATGRISRMLIADVSGHGAAVEDAAARLRTLMLRYSNYLDQTRFVQAMNREFESVSDDGGFATALVATYWAPSDFLTACNAGHPRPLIRRAASGAWSVLEAPDESPQDGLVNLPLGVAEPTSYRQFGVRLHPGDMVLIYTDALIEASDGAGRQLGEEGLLELVRGLNAAHPEQLVRELLETVSAHRDGAPGGDDETVLLLRHNGARPPRLTPVRMAKATGQFIGMLWSDLRGRDEATPWPEVRIETVGGMFFDRLNQRWGQAVEAASHSERKSDTVKQR
ncbi:MAG: serine/threonine-protein phosphatase [Phycisphaeraceae bacterium]|nr:MAG: serine/threonine-protein phosphatase [Phycisphaeraceae bacterium]